MSETHLPTFVLRLPDWLDRFWADRARAYPTLSERMRLAIELAECNVRYGTGGPFGAGVFDMQSHILLAPGVNLVVSQNCSVLHAEIVALILAQQAVSHYDLGAPGLPPYELVSSVEPCAMCMGATPWSGVQRLVCGARDEDARRIGFDEGPKMADWEQALEKRGIEVLRDVCRDQAAAVLQAYAAGGGAIYNARIGQNPGERRMPNPGS